MSDSRSKKAAKIQDSIRQILYQEWDPIGIRGLGPNDEYDSYIAPVYRILFSSRSEQAIVDYLFRTEHGIIGLSRESPEQLRSVAQRLLELNVNL